MRSTVRPVRVTLLCLSTLAAPTLAAAHAGAQAIATSIAPGTRVRVQAPGVDWRVGRLARVDSAGITLRWRPPVAARAVVMDEYIPLAQVQRVETSEPGSRTAGAIKGGVFGLLIGAAVGGALGFATALGSDCGAPCIVIAPMFGAPIVGAAGALIGAAVGVHSGERWRPVALPGAPH